MRFACRNVDGLAGREFEMVEQEDKETADIGSKVLLNVEKQPFELIADFVARLGQVVVQLLLKFFLRLFQLLLDDVNRRIQQGQHNAAQQLSLLFFSAGNQILVPKLVSNQGSAYEGQLVQKLPNFIVTSKPAQRFEIVDGDGQFRFVIAVRVVLRISLVQSSGLFSIRMHLDGQWSADGQDFEQKGQLKSVRLQLLHGADEFGQIEQQLRQPFVFVQIAYAGDERLAGRVRSHPQLDRKGKVKLAVNKNGGESRLPLRRGSNRPRQSLSHVF